MLQEALCCLTFESGGLRFGAAKIVRWVRLWQSSSSTFLPWFHPLRRVAQQSTSSRMAKECLSYHPSTLVGRKKFFCTTVFPHHVRAPLVILRKSKTHVYFFLLIATYKARSCYPSRNCVTISIPFSVFIFLTADLTHAFNFLSLKWFVFINERDKISKNENAVWKSTIKWVQTHVRVNLKLMPVLHSSAQRPRPPGSLPSICPWLHTPASFLEAIDAAVLLSSLNSPLLFPPVTRRAPCMK